VAEHNPAQVQTLAYLALQRRHTYCCFRLEAALSSSSDDAAGAEGRNTRPGPSPALGMGERPSRWRSTNETGFHPGRHIARHD